MRIAIMGAGGIGAVFGAVLAAAGNDVTFIARGAHLAAMQKSGLSIVGHREIQITPLKATDKPSTIDAVDIVLLTVKLWDVRASAESLLPLLHDDTAVVTLQNGVDAARMVSEVLGAKHVIGGVAEISAAIEEPGVVRLNSAYARLRFGELDGRRSARASALETVCIDAGLQAELLSDVEKALWQKFMLLVPVSGLTSVTRSSFGAICADPDTRALLKDCLREVIAVATAKDVAVDADAFEKTMAFIDGMPAEARASMAIDLDLGNRLELPWLSGAVVELGRKLGIATPANGFIHAALKLHQNGRSN